ncbi:hypothetical protein IW262DRAFT_1301337 [Armillaria fumosa]|nr:hypothetical protein IW262DRAFT_1301337 [Armillaria fumosa]
MTKFPIYIGLGMKNDKGTVFTMFRKDGARSLNNEEDLMKYILKPENFEIISKTIDIQDIVHTHQGDQIEAEIARVKCLHGLIDYSDGLKLMKSRLIRPLLHACQAFNEELGTSQWLKTWPGYGELLKETLEKFMLHVGPEHLESLDKDIQERLEQFCQPPSRDQKFCPEYRTKRASASDLSGLLN